MATTAPLTSTSKVVHVTPAHSSQRRCRFAGASSISSAAYFGREEDGPRRAGGVDDDLSAGDLARKLAQQARSDLSTFANTMQEKKDQVCGECERFSGR